MLEGESLDCLGCWGKILNYGSSPDKAKFPLPPYGVFFCVLVFFNSADIKAVLFICIWVWVLTADGVSRALGSFDSGCSGSMGSSQTSSTKTAKPRKYCTTLQVICIIDAKQHPTVQILSLQLGDLPSPSCSLFSPAFHPVRLPPTCPLPSLVPAQALSFSSHQVPDTSIASLHVSAIPATYLPLPPAERRSMGSEDI